MKAPIHLRFSFILLVLSPIFLQVGCKDGLESYNDCCPGDSGKLCPELVHRLEQLSANQGLDTPIELDQDGCPLVKDEWIVQIEGWCNWPFKSPMDSFISNSSWNKVMDAIRKFPCITLIDTVTQEKIQLDSINGLAIKKICPCDSTLIVLDPTKLNNQELGAVRSSSGGPQGNNIFMLPEVGDNFVQEYFEISGDFSFEEGRGRKIAIIDSGVKESVSSAKEGQIIESINIINPDLTADDEYGHGTAVLSIVDMASRVEENHSNHQYLVYKTFDKNGIGTMFDVVCALRGAKLKADMVNMSWGTSKRNKYLTEAIDGFDSKETPLIASKGNDCLMSTIQSPQNFPSDYESVYDVAALDLSLGQFSSTGWADGTFFDPDPALLPQNVDYWNCSNWRKDSLQLIAPGKINVAQGDNRYGTSFAAAYVTGIIARYYYEHNTYPDYSSSGIIDPNYTQMRTAAPHDNINRKIWIPIK